MSDPYPDFVARFYDTVYAQVRDGVDNDFYVREMTSAPGPVLEIGVGTGRLFTQARAQGADVWGIDLSPTMAAKAQDRLPPSDRHRISVADAVSMRLERRFALVVAPFRVLSHVASVEDQLRLLQTVHEHLLPGGRFLFDLYVPAPRLLADGMAGVVDFEGEWAPGRRLRRIIDAQSDIVNQQTHVRMQFAWTEEDGTKREGEWRFDMRFFFRYELEHLVRRSPLVLEAMHGDFAGGPLTPDSREMVVFSRRSEAPRT
jgi:SAM-dependent methyltransferase